MKSKDAAWLLNLAFIISLPHVLMFAAGLNTSLVPMYISEIAPLNLRGGLGTVNQLAVTVGLLTGQVLGVDYLLGTDDGLCGELICEKIAMAASYMGPEFADWLLAKTEEENFDKGQRYVCDEKPSCWFSVQCHGSVERYAS